MDIALLSVAVRVKWSLAANRRAALAAERGDVNLTRQVVDLVEEPVWATFHGPPGILTDGGDVDAEVGASVRLSRRAHHTPDGAAGTSTMHQLREALTDAAERTP